jgi:hypothetical protein
MVTLDIILHSSYIEKDELKLKVWEFIHPLLFLLIPARLACFSRW